MDDTVFDKIQEVDLQKTMEKSYIEYAMSVIASREYNITTVKHYNIIYSPFYC